MSDIGRIVERERRVENEFSCMRRIIEMLSISQQLVGPNRDTRVLVRPSKEAT
jgi:hypothetical protein